MVCITANVLLSNGVAHLIDQVMNPHNDEEGYHDYELADDDQAAVPSFEGTASATISSLTPGIPIAAFGTRYSNLSSSLRSKRFEGTQHECCAVLLWTGSKCVFFLSRLTRMLESYG
jgi:hypothetical protein